MIFVFAGEKSGDHHGAQLLKAIYDKNPHAQITGVGGAEMCKTPMNILIPTERFETMGFLDLVPALPRLIKLFRKVKKAILKHNPDTVILIDYADFNMRMAKALRKSGYKGKIIQYICPTVWAWRKGRIKTLAANLDEIWCILPFEPECFKHTSLKALYIRNPILTEKPTFTPLKFKKPILAIFPGSRTKEIKRNLPLQLKAAQTIAEKHNLQPVISCAHAKFLKRILKFNTPDYPIVDLRHTHTLMRDSYCALATSGTINLQLALYKTPTVVNYAIGRIDQFIAQKILRIDLPHYSLPNIIAGKTIFPELYGSNLTVDNIISSMDALLDKDIAPDCQEIYELLDRGHYLSDVI